MATANRLFFGDNLDVLRRYIPDASVDLIYLDPPFNSDAVYNALFKAKHGSLAASQIKAFDDTWTWDEAAAKAFHETVEGDGGGAVGNALEAFRKMLGDCDMLAYLSIMTQRLKELHRVLKDSGSLYLHCDPTASHYLKIILDAIFGPENFRNEIIWRRTGSHGPRKQFGPIHDVILFFTKTDNYFFEIVRTPYMLGHVQSRYAEQADGRLLQTTGGNILTGAGVTASGESGKPWRGFNPSAKGRHWAVPGDLASQMPASFQGLGVLAKLEALYQAGLISITPGNEWPVPVRYLKEGDGVPLQDIWARQPYTGGTVYGTDDEIDADVGWLGPTSPERLGYPTQKPLGLLYRIIKSSCPESGVVLDPFCGCGTAIHAAELLNRPWIGIDITYLAVAEIKARLAREFPQGVSFETKGEPTSLPDAEALAASDEYQFQFWALGLVGARKHSVKKGADGGIDGRLIFHDDVKGSSKHIIISVKAGKNISVAHVRDLRGVVEREKAAIGVLITMHEPTKPMRQEAASAGFYTSAWGSPGTTHPRIQILTIKELLEGGRIDYPAFRGFNVTHMPATFDPSAPVSPAKAVKQKAIKQSPKKPIPKRRQKGLFDQPE
jgi:DNA modification methylase